MQEIGRQPLFQLLAAAIVLLVTDAAPLYGLAAAAIWIAWVAWSTLSPSTTQLFGTPK
jgi:hypothetical protein